MNFEKKDLTDKISGIVLSKGLEVTYYVDDAREAMTHSNMTEQYAPGLNFSNWKWVKMAASSG